MTIRTDATARGGPTEFISGRFQRDYRRVFDEIFSLSGEGRLTLAVLKEISATLLRFFQCRAAEIVYEEKHKVWHAKSIAGRCWTGWAATRAGPRKSSASTARPCVKSSSA